MTNKEIFARNNLADDISLLVAFIMSVQGERFLNPNADLFDLAKRYLEQEANKAFIGGQNNDTERTTKSKTKID